MSVVLNLEHSAGFPDAALVNLEAEWSLLGGLLTNNSQAHRVAGLVKAEDFIEVKHGELFNELMGKILGGDEVSVVLLKGWQAEFEKHGLKDYLQKIMGFAAGTINLIPYAREIHDLASKRRLLEALDESAKLLRSGSKETAPAIANSLVEKASKVFVNASETKILTSIDVANQIIADMDKGGIKRISTGFAKIDESMNGGMEYGKAYCIAARPKCGKTMLMGSIAKHVAKSGEPFLYVAAEMGAKQIFKRIVGSEVNRAAVAFDGMDVNALKALQGYMETHPEGLYWTDAPRISLSDLRAVISRAVYSKGIKGFVLDYAQLVTGKESGENEAYWIENVAQTISEICKKEGIWCLYACQTNRDDKIRGSDGIIMAADWVYQIKKIESASKEQNFYLSCLASRAGRAIDIGSEEKPYLQMAVTGTHFKEIE